MNAAAELKPLLLASPKLTLAAAESLTCGRVQAAIGSVSGASEYFLGGITAYSLDQKVRHLGVERAAAARVNSVSSPGCRMPPTFRTTSPNSARAPELRASSMPISRVVTSPFSSTISLAMSSMRLNSSGVIGLVCAKSKRNRSGDTSEPRWAIWSPST